jgi:hypothetical protein
VYAASRDLKVTGESAVPAVQRFLPNFAPPRAAAVPFTNEATGVAFIILFEKTAFISVPTVTQSRIAFGLQRSRTHPYGARAMRERRL